MDAQTSPPLAPPTSPPWRVDEPVEGWARPIGIFSVAFAVLGLNFCALSLLGGQVYGIQREPGQWVEFAFGAAFLFLFIMLAIAGVLTARGRGAGRPWHLWSALLLLPSIMLAITVPVDSTGSYPASVPIPSPSWGELALGIVAQFLIAGGYPIFLIVWFAPRRRSPDSPGAMFRVRSRRVRIPR